MHTCELAELSGLIAANGGVFVRRRGRISESSIGQYWSASKDRFEHWMRVLCAVPPPGRPGFRPATRGPVPAAATAVCEEVFASELLTRVWTVLVCQLEQEDGPTCTVPVVRNVMQAHQHARHRALKLLGDGLESRQLPWRALDKLRRRAEHWTDLLLAQLHPFGARHAEALAFDVPRMREFAQDVADLKSDPHGDRGWRLFQAALKPAFQGGARPSANEALNGQIAASILACFPPEFFEAIGPFRALWLERLQHTTVDALTMLDNLLATEVR
jgi:hypothetical protein